MDPSLAAGRIVGQPAKVFNHQPPPSAHHQRPAEFPLEAQGLQKPQRLNGFSKSHVVGQDSPQLEFVQIGHPASANFLIRLEGKIEIFWKISIAILAAAIFEAIKFGADCLPSLVANDWHAGPPQS